MKLVKLSIFALAMGFFVASCGSSESTEESAETVDTAMMAPEVVPAPVDTMTAAPAMDSAAVSTEAAH